MAKSYKQNNKLEARRREEEMRRRHFDQVIREREKKRQAEQKKWQARRVETEKLAEASKKRPLKQKNKPLKQQKSHRIRSNKPSSLFYSAQKSAPKVDKVKSKGLPTKYWVFTGLLALIFLGGLLYFLLKSEQAAPVAEQKQETSQDAVRLNLQQPLPSKKASAAAKPDQTVKPKAVAATKPKVAAKPTPKFEFYTILPQQQAWSPDGLDQGQDAAIKEVTRLQQGQYVLQLGSFKAPQDAKRLSSRLEKLNFRPYLVTVTLPSGTWTRVMLGPFANKRAVEQVRQQLQQAKLSPGLLKSKA